MMKWILIVLLIGLLFVFCIHTLTDINQDIGFHLTVGKLIWQTHHVPSTNFFSYTNPDFEFINQHWLAKVAFYLVSVAVGLKGLILFQAAIVTGAFILAFFAFYKRESISISILAGLLSILILVDRSLVRPEIFSFLFFGWYLFVLFSKPKPKFLWSLPIVQLIWINTHIYFFLGPMTYLFFLIDRFVKDRKDFKLKVWPLIRVGIVIALVNFINPFGWKGAVYPLLIFKNYGAPILENMDPFKAMSFGYPAVSIYTMVIAMVITVISSIINRRNFKNNIFEILLILASATLSLMMLRDMPIFALVIMPVITKNLYESRVYWANKSFWGLLTFIIAIMILSVTTNQLQAGINRQFGLIIPDWGQKAIDFVKDNNISGPVFNNMNTGSLLLWKIPDQKVFIDTRTEAYPADWYKNVFVPMQSDPEEWKLYSEKYKINYVFYAYKEITPWAQKFVADLSNNNEWAIVYLDDKVVIFVKNLPQNSEVIKKYQIFARYK